MREAEEWKKRHRFRIENLLHPGKNSHLGKNRPDGIPVSQRIDDTVSNKAVPPGKRHGSF